MPGYGNRSDVSAAVSRRCPSSAATGQNLLLHLLRGAGLEGLAAMATAKQDVLRPLLAVQTEEIAAYCRREGLCWRHDASNDDPSYRRNRIRLELLPQLEH